MAIHYIPTEYKKGTMSALGYWAKSMQPMMQMWMQHKMQEDARQKQFDMMQKARAEQQDKMDYSRLREGGWQTAEDLGYKGDNIPKPTVVKQGQGLYRPKLRKEALPDGGHAIFYGNKYITMTKSEDPKLTRGTPYVSNGHRKVPFYNTEGKKAHEVDLGEVRVEENLTKQEESDIHLEQQKKFAAYKESLKKEKDKSLTVDDINKRLKGLHESKVRLQTTKGVDALTLFLMQDNPEAKKAYTEGNIEPAVKEIDRQIGHYGDLLNKKQSLRADGTPKGPGFLGTLKRPDGKVSTELSIGVKLGGKEIEIPSLVPTLTKDEVNYLLEGNKPTKQIVNKAVKHAKKRIAEGKSPFAQKKEQPEKWTIGEIYTDAQGRHARYLGKGTWQPQEQ